MQFTAVPWLRDHMIETTRTLAVDLAPTPQELTERLTQLATKLPQAFQSGSNGLAERIRPA